MEAKNARFSGDKAVAERNKGVVPAGCRTVNRAPRIGTLVAICTNIRRLLISDMSGHCTGRVLRCVVSGNKTCELSEEELRGAFECGDRIVQVRNDGCIRVQYYLWIY